MLQKPLRTIAALVLALTVAGCADDSAFVRADIESIAREDLGGKADVTLLNAWVGEGDAEHRYYYAQIIVRAREEIRIDDGLFKKLVMKPGDPKRQFTVELSYKWREGRWHLFGRRLVTNTEDSGFLGYPHWVNGSLDETAERVRFA